MTDLTKLTLAEARDGLAKGEYTSVELTEAHLKSMETHRNLNAYITETPEKAIEMAKASDAKRAKGEAGKMEGLPIAVKDLFCTEGVQTTAASHILEGFKPEYESTVTSKLFENGAVMLGKANLDEFAMGSSNTSSYYGNAINPWKGKDGKDLVPGGSSGGSAAAVAANMALAATGTDTGGSIRQPASYCGIVGLKPTYGRCSRWGIVAFASSLDQAGPMTKTVRDAAIMLGSMAGHDAKDSTSAPMAVPDFEAALTGDIRGMKIGIPKEYRVDGMPEEISKLWDDGVAMLRDAGAEVVDVTLPHTKYALGTYYIVAPAEASSNLARYDGLRYGQRVMDEGDSLDDMYMKSRAAGFGKEVQRRIMIGTYVLSAGYYDAYYNKALKVRRRIYEDFANAFGTVDTILAPTAPSAAFAIGENEGDPVKMYLNDVFTVPASLAGLPGLSLPTGLSSEGLPLGLQLIGKPFDEETVLRVGGVLESAANFTAKPSGLEG
ncbi:Asp-tRNA(Asn)/Glu-tRNA(Gln) amidotransferase subunit GatA [Thalassospira sp. GO-4]|jgi:aspartyl-tRNA(Asn)/glutamyl-tRNA(Gln) amidotransferase subunit A|uniref:Asp-tRNA(Asn)/Glu-tRNA(Gln) amidotransferase subunit GatA n=1 Tax=Thalassospira sp. GO-4 TaxID=2946605 RepID=UPI0020253B0D|nr:Asp-tRNA(Asn)/Glu-tRNA(Gln) amidotransferase subunit GatA [Thalassospira sp. GO-4]URK18552.1 Asp-tRNA(Asn)/Glu-tRNA(Gln) amidotransferase subunit GatA [Thalassospira sp. GO-4]